MYCSKKHGCVFTLSSWPVGDLPHAYVQEAGVSTDGGKYVACAACHFSALLHSLSCMYRYMYPRCMLLEAYALFNCIVLGMPVLPVRIILASQCPPEMPAPQICRRHHKW